MSDRDLLEALFVLRWWQLGLSLGILAMLIVLTVSKWLQYRWDKIDTAGYMDELRLLIRAARTAAESARANHVDANSSRDAVKKKSDENTAKVVSEVRAVPERVAERLGD